MPLVEQILKFKTKTIRSKETFPKVGRPFYNYLQTRCLLSHKSGFRTAVLSAFNYNDNISNDTNIDNNNNLIITRRFKNVICSHNWYFPLEKKMHAYEKLPEAEKEKIREITFHGRLTMNCLSRTRHCLDPT